MMFLAGETLLESIFGKLADIVGYIVSMFQSLFGGVIGIFWNSTSGTLTDVGILTLVGSAMALFIFVLNWITRLIKVKAGK